MEIVFLSDGSGGTVEFIRNKKKSFFSGRLSLGFYTDEWIRQHHLKAHEDLAAGRSSSAGRPILNITG